MTYRFRLFPLTAAASFLNPLVLIGAEELAGRASAPAVPISGAASEASWAMDFFMTHGVLKGPEDPLRGHLFDGQGALTPIGERLARYLRRHPKSVPDFSSELDRLRNVGPKEEGVGVAVRSALADFDRRFGEISRAGAEDSWALGAELETVVSGAASAELEERPVVVIPTASGVDILDARGLSARGQVGGEATYDRGIAELQKRMDDPGHRPACASVVPVTGRINPEMRAYGRCRLRVELERLDARTRSDRVQRMAELLGQPPGREFSEHDLETRRTVGGYSAGDLADVRLARRRSYLKAARRVLEASNEDLASVYATLARLESRRYDLLRQRDRLGDGPDAAGLKEAVRRSPLNAAERSAYLGRGRELLRRIDRLSAVLRLLEAELERVGGRGPSRAGRSALARLEIEADRLQSDLTAYQTLPILARSAQEASSEPFWNATSRATSVGARLARAASSWWGGDWGAAYLNRSADMERARYDEVFPAAMRAVAATGDFRDAAAELARAGAAGPRALDHARRTLQAVAEVQAEAGVAVHLVGWSLGSAVLAPALSAGLSASGAWLLRWGRGLLALEESGAASRSAGLALRAAGLILDNTARRLEELDAPIGSLRAETAVLRMLEGASVRFMNSSVRLGSFAATSVIFSGISMVIRESEMAKGAAFVRGASAGAEWSLDAWHPMLLVSGLPSNVAEGTAVASASETAATQGAVGLVSSAARGLLRRAGSEDAARALSRWSLERLSEAGTPGGWAHAAARWTAQIAGAADNAAKYMALPSMVRAAAQEAAFLGETRSEIAEDRVRRAVIAGLKAMSAPVWLFVPVTPASSEAEAAEARRGAQGLRERIARGEADAVVGAGEGGRLRLYEPLETFGLERLLHFQAYRDRAFQAGNGASFRVTPAVLREVVRHELPRAAAESSPLRYLEISRPGVDGRVGPLWITDLVRDEACGLFAESLLRRPALAARVLAEENLGRVVEGFGRMTARVQEEAASAVLRSVSNAEVPLELAARARRILEPYLGTESAVAAAAKEGAGPAYLQAIQARFSHFNRPRLAGARLDRILLGMEREYEVREPVRKGLAAFRRMLRRAVERAAELGDQYGLELPADPVFRDLALKWRNIASKFPEDDASVLSAAADEAEAAPWLLRDAKGRPIKGWRPEQAELLSEFARLWSESKDSSFLRAFLLMKTGGGKTLMAIEGLAPLLEANGRKTLFLTVRSNLESQARMEFRSLKKGFSSLEFGTWAGFKARLAQDRIRGAVSKGWNILGDEADGAASEPMLSIGERTVEIGRASPIYSVYRRMKTAMYFTGGEDEAKVTETMERYLDGLTRRYARELMTAAYRDPGLTIVERWRLMALIAPSAFWPRGSSNRGSSWVREELLNLARGYGEDPNSVRMDHATGRLHRVHLGQWFENMDAPTRRFWELELGAALTLPYEHRACVTLNDILIDHSTNLAAFSGTLSPRLRELLVKNGVAVVGAGSEEAPADIDIRSGPSDKYSAVSTALQKVAGDPRSLVITVVPGMRELRVLEHVLSRTGIASKARAKIFSDAEYLRERRPQSLVSEQMNLSGLESGQVRHLALDARVAGRGLDLDFRAYRKIVMLILDPQKMSADALKQSQGRIAEGRVPKEMKREFRLILDLPRALQDRRFSKLLTLELESSGISSVSDRRYGAAVARALKARQAEIGDEELRVSGMLGAR